MKNENFFDSVVFPEVLDGLKNKKSKKTYENSCIDESKIPLQKEVDAFCKKCSPKVGLITKLVSMLGLSSKDITTIKLTDIHMHNGEPYLLLNKNAYSRYVFIPEKLKNQIENYIQD